MESVNHWTKPVNSAANVSGIAPNGGSIGRGLGPAGRPAKKQGSFGGTPGQKSRLPGSGSQENPVIQFGSFPPVGNESAPSFDAPQNLDNARVSEFPTATTVNDALSSSSERSGARGDPGHSRGKQLPSPHVQPAKTTPSASRPSAAPANKVWAKESPAPQPGRAASGEVRITEGAECSKDSDSRSYPAFSSTNEEDFPQLGAPSRPENRAGPKPGGGSSINYGIDNVARVEASRRDAGVSGAKVEGYRMHDQYETRSSRGGDSSGGGRDIDALGRTLTRILRHQAVELKLKIRPDGYTEVDELLRLPVKTRFNRALSSHTVEDVLLAVQQDNKQRFGIKDDSGVLLIRANQGHTIKTVESEHLLEPILSAEEIPVCVHGTYRENVDPILKQGLKRMQRNHVHFATGLAPTDGVISGMRKTCNILIYLDVGKALQDGMKLYRSENGVILTEGFGGVVPPKYFREVRSLPDGKLVKGRV
ncbi:hypothetical protein R1sor_005078 [Riccia sorocarpa]|uniref:2'-phosphotransferase n=1 Tax=Riccia sorocarpa TaxID=122646 RepID=A0ABD3HIS8_9MARC